MTTRHSDGITIKQRLQPLISGAVSLSDLDPHTRQALDIYCHFRAAEIVEGKTVEQIKADLERLPESVRELMTEHCRKAYKRLCL